ncbi:MAG: hypothetical protein QM764_20335 [Chitinophagaceae bacterium]
MKKMYISLLMGCMACCSFTAIKAQEFKEHINKEIAASANSVLAVYNIDGSVKVIGYAGDKIIFDVDKKITAKTSDELEKGKKEFQLAIDKDGDTVEAYIAGPFDSRPHHQWNDNWDDRRVRYRYNLEFTIKVPFGMSISISTVNGGKIDVKDVTGNLDLSNVNGSISISGAKGITDAHTVNGDITATYVSVPADQSSYNTVNGDLNVTYPTTLSADMEFQSLNGNFYTDFTEVQTLPFKVVKNDEREDGGTVYKLDKNSSFRFGKGGKVFRFETLNGNVYIKKQS